MKPYLAIRIDVDTYPGLYLGLPSLLSTLEDLGVRTTIFLPTGPDSSGLALARVLRSPGRLRQLTRARPGGSSFFTIALAGILFPVRLMSSGLRFWRDRLQDHELSLHGHDHWRWLHNIDQWSERRITAEIAQGCKTFASVMQRLPVGFGAPGWRSSPASLAGIEHFGFSYSADCRGLSPFVPEGKTVPQLPTTFPTLEEVLRARTGGPRTILDSIPRALETTGYHCYCVHTELEGMRFPEFLRSLLETALSRGAAVGTLGAVVSTQEELPICHVGSRLLPGRMEIVSYQEHT
jgi:undecaprenyl phosphate-alpha-L-ara4FN deformylase